MCSDVDGGVRMWPAVLLMRLHGWDRWIRHVVGVKACVRGVRSQVDVAVQAKRLFLTGKQMGHRSTGTPYVLWVRSM